MSSKALCRSKCEEERDCGGYTYAASGTCTLYGWSNDLKLLDSVKGDVSGVCDLSTVEEFSLIGCFPQGNAVKYGLLFREKSETMGTNVDGVGKCKDYCKHTCYMALLGRKCWCSDNPQIGVPFSQTPDAYCSYKTNCNVQYGCGSSNNKYMSVYSNNQLRSSKCKGKPIWGKTCSYEVGQDASGVIFKSFKKKSAVFCQQECEKDRRCGCFTYMPGVCNLKPKGISCGLKSYKSSCAFVSGTCSINSGRFEGGKSSMSTSMNSVNFAVMGKMKIQNADGGYLSAAQLTNNDPNIVSETCSANDAKCEWELDISRLSREGFVAWDIRSASKPLFVHVVGGLTGLQDKNQAKLSTCTDPNRRCSWVLEPIRGKKDHFHIRTSGGNTYLRKKSTKVYLDACDSLKTEVVACQWKVKGQTTSQPQQADAIASHLRYSVRLAGTDSWFKPKNAQDNLVENARMQVFPCDKRDGWESCYWYFEKSAASVGGQDTWYIKASPSKVTTGLVKNNYVWLKDGTTPKLGACNENIKKSPFRQRDCQWILEPKGDNKYMIRSVSKIGYLQVTASKAQLLADQTQRKGIDISYGTCTDEPKCTWEFTGVFPSRVAFDVMGRVKISTVALTTGNMFLHASGSYGKQNGKWKDKQINTINAWKCKDGGNEKSWHWRCEYMLEKHDPKSKDSNVWYIKQWNGRIGTGTEIGPKVYVSVPSTQQKETGEARLDTCAEINGKRPEECQWVFEPVEGSTNQKFMLRNVAVSKKWAGKNLYLRKVPGSTQQKISFQDCSDSAKECQWFVKPTKSGFTPLCMPGPLKKFSNIDIKVNDLIDYQDKTVDECNGLCHAREGCVGFVMAPYGRCWLKGKINFNTNANSPQKNEPRDTYMLTGSFPACNSPQPMTGSAKAIVQPQADFVFDGCVDGAVVPTKFHKTNDYDDTVAVGACMEICQNFCVMMLGWNNKCVCSNTYPERKEFPLGFCGSEPYTNGRQRAASVFVNMGGGSKCTAVKKLSVSAGEKGTKQCSMTVGMRGVADTTKGNRATCISSQFNGGFFFDVTGTHFGCAEMQKGTAEECAGKCASDKDCAGYMFDKADADKKKRSCGFFKWGVVWKYEFKEKHVTGTCDDKPVDAVTLFGCYKKSDVSTKFSSTTADYKKCVKWCAYTCYMAFGKGNQCACANKLPTAAEKKTQTICNEGCGNGISTNGCGDKNSQHWSMYANNVLRLNSKCSEKHPWRRTCTKEPAVKVLGDDLAGGVEETTAGACHHNCEGNPNCGCYTWDPVDGKCYQKKTKAASGKAKQCTVEKHDGMVQLISGRCQ